MTINRLLLSILLIFLLQAPGNTAAVCKIPGTTADCRELTANLPWPFIIHVKEEKPVRITYLSTQEKQQLNPNVKMFLEVSTHENHTAAGESFSQVQQKAHPDMGLSYGWDLVLVRDRLIYHLHADCTLAEHHFMSMVESLIRILPDTTSPKTLFCRCGGGCKVTGKVVE